MILCTCTPGILSVPRSLYVLQSVAVHHTIGAYRTSSINNVGISNLSIVDLLKIFTPAGTKNVGTLCENYRKVLPTLRLKVLCYSTCSNLPSWIKYKACRVETC